MAKAKNKKNNKVERNIKSEILGILIVSLGLISLLSMYNSSTGLIGNIIKKYFILFSGIGGYVIPVIILLLGFIIITNKKHQFKRNISIIITYFGILTLIDISTKPSIDGLTLFNRINQSITATNEALMTNSIVDGGGIIGSVFSYLFLNLFGSVGSYIVIIAIILISFLVFANISILYILRSIFNKTTLFFKSLFKNLLNFLYVDINEKKSSNKNEKNEVDIEDLIDLKIDNNNNDTQLNYLNDNQIKEVDNKIRVLDYTKNSTDIVKNEVKTEISEDMISPITNDNQESYQNFKLPDVEILNDIKTHNTSNEKKEVIQKANKLIDTLANFGIEAKILQINIGPSITRFEIQPAPGVKVSKIVSLTNDIALSLASSDIRMEAPIPGKSAIGIEIPNKNKAGVSLKEILQSNEFKEIDSLIPFALGKDITGKPIVTSIDSMPHLLVAGATGSGKSVCINTLISSILFKAKPDEVKLMLIDPKVVELSIYNGIPHLLIPVVTDPKKAASSLNWAVQEMTRRYSIFAKNNVRDLSSYNKKANNNEEMEKLPQIVIIIDELADLMMVAASEVEDYICRLAQMARAAGIHLIIATQRPSVDIITGTIKANIPSRIAFSVSSQADSRTILDMGGAEKLLGKGDMLFFPVGDSKPTRIQGAFISEEEIIRVVEYLKKQGNANYENSIVEEIENKVKLDGNNVDDELLPKAIELVIEEGQASISLLQRRLKIGYARAARIVDELEERGIIGGYEGSKPRKVLISKEDYQSNNILNSN